MVETAFDAMVETAFDAIVEIAFDAVPGSCYFHDNYLGN